MTYKVTINEDKLLGVYYCSEEPVILASGSYRYEGEAKELRDAHNNSPVTQPLTYPIIILKLDNITTVYIYLGDTLKIESA